jgi:hypothetical protein
MEKKINNRLSWLLGGLIGLFIPLILFGLFLILNSFGTSFGGNPITALLVFAIAFIQLPIVIMGRTLGLPIETGGEAFIMYNFTPLGYILTVIFWTLLGALCGWIINKKLKRNKNI